jgi:hypothetical protein
MSNPHRELERLVYVRRSALHTWGCFNRLGKENAVAMAKASKSLDEVMPDKKHKLCRRQHDATYHCFVGNL